MSEEGKKKRKNAPQISPHYLARWFQENDANPKRIMLAANALMESEGEEHRFDLAGIKGLYTRLNAKLKAAGMAPLKLKTSREDFSVFINEWTLKNVLKAAAPASSVASTPAKKPATKTTK